MNDSTVKKAVLSIHNFLGKCGFPPMKELMLGNKAVARGLYEAGCRLISSYPGTPSTEITENVTT